MKKLLFAFTFLLASMVASAQLPDPVTFTYSVKKVDSKKYELHILAKIEDGWHLYAQEQPKQAVAQPTLITINKNPLILLSPGKPKEIGKKETYENKEVDIKQYQYGHSVEFVKGFTMRVAVKTNLSGTIKYQVCTDERCLPVKSIPFSIQVE